MTSADRVYDILNQLVAFETVAGNGEAHAACLDYCEKLLTDAGLTVNQHESQKIPSLVALTRPGKHSQLILQAHLDVVPGDKQLFKVRKSDEKFWGRGVYDMKFAAACFLAAAEQLPNSELDYAIMLTCDEEVGGRNGVKYLLKQEGYTAEACLLPDAGDDWEVEETAKGAWFVSVAVAGQAAHGSRPWEGDNAIHRLMDFLHDLRQSLETYQPEQLTVVVSKIKGGEALNQVPHSAIGSLDIRFATDDIRQAVAKLLLKLGEQYEVSLSSREFANVTRLDVSLPMVQSWEATVAQAARRARPSHCASHGSSDARFFTAAGIPTIVTRPKGGGAHGAEEWIDEADLYKFYDCVEAFVRHQALPTDQK